MNEQGPEPIASLPAPATTGGQAGGSTAVSDPATDVVIKCSQLTKIFRDFWFRNRVRAVDGVDLEVHRGEVFGLLGPNGSGKSTAIKIMLGLLHPTAGRVMVLGKRPDNVAIKNQIGYLPEESYLYRFLNARETLEYYGCLFHQGRSQRKRRIDMLLKMVGLDAVQRRPVGEYSKGMQRRIGLAQALINDPQLLILDEPTTGLDPIGTRQIKDLILTLKQRGKTILLCSHLLADVEDICDRVAIMYGGKIQRAGPVDRLLTQQHMTSIHCEELDAETIDEIDGVLARRGKHIDKVEQPRQKLESLFLDIVHEAQSRGAVTSGAHAGGPIAEFLTDDDRGAHLPESAEAAGLIDRLLSPAPTKPPQEQTERTEAATSPAEPAAGRDVIADLSGEPPPMANPSEPELLGAPAPEGQSPDKSKDQLPDQEVLKTLLNTPQSHGEEDEEEEDGRTGDR